jgi:cytochrome c-type biogenesis protein CcmH/NrfF
MSALAWLAIPVVALVLGVAWVMWAGRERPRADTHDTLEEHERFKAAFEPRGRGSSRDSQS